jgi:hypothetical protein
LLTLSPLILDSRCDLGAHIPNPTQTSIHIIYHKSPFYFHNMHLISPWYLHLLYLHNIPKSSQIIDAADVLPNYIICPYMVWEYRQMSLSQYYINFHNIYIYVYIYKYIHMYTIWINISNILVLVMSS